MSGNAIAKSRIAAAVVHDREATDSSGNAAGAVSRFGRCVDLLRPTRVWQLTVLVLPPLLIIAGIRLYRDSSGVPRVQHEAVPARPSREFALENNDCGPACLYLICRLADRPQSLDVLRRAVKPNDSGTSLLRLRDAAQDLGFETEAVRGDFATLASRVASKDSFAILHVRSNHFVVAEGVTNDGAVRVLDPYRGAVLVAEGDLRKASYRWQGVMLFLTAPASEGDAR